MTAEQERAAVVAWLRDYAMGVFDIPVTINGQEMADTVRFRTYLGRGVACLAAAIERGEHLRGGE